MEVGPTMMPSGTERCVVRKMTRNEVIKTCQQESIAIDIKFIGGVWAGDVTQYTDRVRMTKVIDRLHIRGPLHPPKGITRSPAHPQLSAFLPINLHLYGNCVLWNPKLRVRSEDV